MKHELMGMVLVGEGGIPFNTQFFQDDDDDAPGFDDPYDGDGGASVMEPGEQDLLAATQGQTRRVRPEAINYAKRAKRVDVRKLKENIWKGLDIVVAAPKENPDEDVDMVRTVHYILDCDADTNLVLSFRMRTMRTPQILQTRGVSIASSLICRNHIPATR